MTCIRWCFFVLALTRVPVHFTNSTSVIERGFVTQTAGSWMDGDIHVGFNGIAGIHDKEKEEAGCRSALTKASRAEAFLLNAIGEHCKSINFK
jgi:hypothetical protein